MLGSPIAHSLSPALHREAYAATGLDWSYDAHEVTEVTLGPFLDSLDTSWRGLSLTMPLKRSVLPMLDEVSTRAQQAAAANTVILDGHRRCGHNTDVGGAVAAITERSQDPIGEAVILGGGATAASVLLALADLGCRAVTVLVRDVDRAAGVREAAARHATPPDVLVTDLSTGTRWQSAPADILVSTIPAGAQTDQVTRLGSTVPVVFDVVYDPWPTPLASMASMSGQILVSGLDLLVHQAAEQFLLMTEMVEAPLARMRAAGERALRARHSRPGQAAPGTAPRTHLGSTDER